MPSAVTFCYLTALKVSAQISNLPEEFLLPFWLYCVCFCVCLCVCGYVYVDKKSPKLLSVAREKCFVTKNFKTETETEEKRLKDVVKRCK